MIKLLDIIEEGTLTLTPEERQQLETIIPEIIEIIKTKNIPSSGQVWSAGKISYIYSDGEKGEVEIGVGAIDKNAKGQFSTYDKNNRTDNWIFINQTYFKQFFPGPNSFQDFDQRLYRTVTGNENTGIERLRQTLKHELIHAKDPALNHHYLKQAYDPNDEAIYYKSWAEFQTFTGQFFESLITGTDRVLNTTNNPGDIKRIEKALSNILQYFAGKTKIISIETKEFIDGTGSRKFFQKIFNFVSQIIKTPSDSDYALSEYLTYLSKIKQHNPEGYKEFLKDLYKTIKSIEEKVNSISTTKIKIQEMKSNINEITRMQQLAGIITEVEANVGQGVEKGLLDILGDLKSAASTIKPSPKDGQINELGPLTLFALTAGAPGLINLLGKAVDGAANYFSYGAVGQTQAGQWLQKKGHDLEHKYIEAISYVLKKAYPKKFGNQDPFDQTSPLYDAAHGVYAAILTAAAVASGFEAANAVNLVIKGLEGGAAAFKTAEVIQLAQKIVAA